MKLTQYRVDEIMTLVRRPVQIRPEDTYHEIGIRSFGNGIFHKSPVTGQELGSKRVFQIETGDLIFSNVFAWEGAVALASERDAGRIGSHRFMTYQVKLDKADPRYLRYYFYGGPGLRVLNSASPGSAGRNRTLGVQTFNQQVVELPSKDVQQRIADKLDSAMSRIRELSAAVPDTSVTWNLAAAGLDKILSRWSEGMIRVERVCSLSSETVHPGDDPGAAREFVGLEHIMPHLGVRLGSRPLGDEKGRKFRFHPGDILYGYLRPYLNKVWLADRHGLCSVEQYVLRPSGSLPGELIAAALRSRATLNQVLTATHSLQLPRLRSGLLLALEVPYIPPENHAQAVAEVGDFMHKVRTLKEQQDQRDKTRKALRPAVLEAAFSGWL